MRFFDMLKPTFVPVNIQGVSLQFKKLSWAELTELESEAKKDLSPVEYFAYMCEKYVRDEDGAPIAFSEERPATMFPVSFCTEVIETVFTVSTRALPSREEVEKK